MMKFCFVRGGISQANRLETSTKKSDLAKAKVLNQITGMMKRVYSGWANT